MRPGSHPLSATAAHAQGLSQIHHLRESNQCLVSGPQYEPFNGRLREENRVERVSVLHRRFSHGQGVHSGHRHLLIAVDQQASPQKLGMYREVRASKARLDHHFRFMPGSAESRLNLILTHNVEILRNRNGIQHESDSLTHGRSHRVNGNHFHHRAARFGNDKSLSTGCFIHETGKMGLGLVNADSSDELCLTDQVQTREDLSPCHL